MSYFKAKMHQVRFWPGLRPRTSAEGAQVLPHIPQLDLKGHTSEGREREGGQGSGGEGSIFSLYFSIRGLRNHITSSTMDWVNVINSVHCWWCDVLRVMMMWCAESNDDDTGELTPLLDDNSDDEIKQQRKLVWHFLHFIRLLNVIMKNAQGFA